MAAFAWFKRRRTRLTAACMAGAVAWFLFYVVVPSVMAAQHGMSASSVFGQDDTQMPPARLATACEHSVAFDAVGYMSPNER
jgi:hypothetical protein